MKRLDEFNRKEKGLSTGSRRHMMRAFQLLGLNVPKAFEEMAKEDLQNFFEKIKPNYLPSTLRMFKVNIKRGYRWIEYERTNKDRAEKDKVDISDVEFPYCVKWVKFRTDLTEIPFDSLVTEEEYKKMVNTLLNQRDRALLMALWESALRSEELLSLRIRNVQFDKYGAVMMLPRYTSRVAKKAVNHKTGTRSLRLVDSVPDLMKWIEMHPLRDNVDAPLWVSKRKTKKVAGKLEYAQLEYYGLYKMLKRAAREAGIEKDVRPHLVRHMRLTKLATVLTESELRNFAGWSKTSRMPAVYVHVSRRGIDKKILKERGVQIEEAEREEVRPLERIKCPRCATMNSATGKFCMNCSMVLDAKTALELDEERKKIDEVMTLALDDPEVQKLLLEKAKAIMRAKQ